MNVLLVDDELYNCELLQILLEFYIFEDLQVVGQVFFVDQVLNILRRYDVDLVFLDIQMLVKDGFDLLKLFEREKYEVIFVISFDDYVIWVIWFDVIDYFVKLVDVQELK